MEQNHLSDNHIVLWQNLEEAYGDYIAARSQLFEEASDSLVLLVNRALKTNHVLTRSLAFEMADLILSTPQSASERFSISRRCCGVLILIEKRIFLIDALLTLVGWDKTYGAARDLILSLPHGWLIANIEAHAENILNNANNRDNYARLLGIYSTLDKSLMQRLARRAAQSDDQEIREIGESWLAD